MKTLRFIFLFILAVLCGLFAFSYIASLEDGSNEAWLIVTSVMIGAIDYLLATLWDKQGKLPGQVTDRNNDRA